MPLPDVQFSVNWKHDSLTPLHRALGSKEVPLLNRHFLCARENLGLGSFYHRREILKCLWPDYLYCIHPWAEARLKDTCDSNFVVWAAGGGAGKSVDAAAIALEYWLEAPHETAVIVCSTTVKELRRRIWNALARLHSNLPSHIEFRDDNGILIERTKLGFAGRLLDSDLLIRCNDGDSLNGIFGIAVDEGPPEEAIKRLVGFHTKRVWWILDEMQGVKKAIMDTKVMANICRNPFPKFLGMGNPESRLGDEHGRAMEPIGGWSAIKDIEQRVISNTTNGVERWAIDQKTFPGPPGIATFFDGRKSPAVLDPAWGKEHPWMINQEQIDGHLRAVRGNETDPSYLSQSVGWWPTQGSDATVLDDVIIERFRCRERAVWTNGFFKWGSLDPAFSSGGDKAVLTFGKCGEVADDDGIRWVVEVTEQMDVPLSSESSEPIHYQIVNFVMRECQKRHIEPDSFGSDSSGEGGGLAAIFTVQWGPIQEVEFGGAPSDTVVSVDEKGETKTAREMYDRRSSELNLLVREFAMANGLRGLPEQAAGQFCRRRTSYKLSKWTVEPKTTPKGSSVKGYKQRCGHSPDCSDSVAIGLEVCRRKGAVAFSAIGSPKQTQDWNDMAAKMDRVFDEEQYGKEEAWA